MLLLGACRAAAPALDPGPSHLGEAWYAFRAEALGLSVAEARARDAAMPTDAPPADFGDEATRREARALWRDHCAACHGTRGRLEDATTPLPPGQAPPRDWGAASSDFAFWMAGDGFRTTVYRRIARGGDRDGRPSAMPAWETQLSREQIWALVFWIDSL